MKKVEVLNLNIKSKIKWEKTTTVCCQDDASRESIIECACKKNNLFAPDSLKWSVNDKFRCTTFNYGDYYEDEIATIDEEIEAIMEERKKEGNM